MKAGIEQENLQAVARRRITLFYGFQIVSQIFEEQQSTLQRKPQTYASKIKRLYT